MKPTNEKKDPRFFNEKIEAKTLSEYLKEYASRLEHALNSVDSSSLSRAYDLMKQTIENGGHVYAAGNGGSASICDHLCCDWMKGTALAGKPSLKVHSLPANGAILTALSNDFSYEQCFSKQLEYLATEKDLIILISCSGNSPNVVEAAQFARSKNLPIIGMTGFSGGKLKELASVSLHVLVSNYGIVEDAHQSLMHVLSQFLAKQRDTL